MQHSALSTPPDLAPLCQLMNAHSSPRSALSCCNLPIPLPQPSPPASSAHLQVCCRPPLPRGCGLLSESPGAPPHRHYRALCPPTLTRGPQVWADHLPAGAPAAQQCRYQPSGHRRCCRPPRRQRPGKQQQQPGRHCQRQRLCAYLPGASAQHCCRVAWLPHHLGCCQCACGGAVCSRQCSRRQRAAATVSRQQHRRQQPSSACRCCPLHQRFLQRQRGSGLLQRPSTSCEARGRGSSRSEGQPTAGPSLQRRCIPARSGPALTGAPARVHGAPAAAQCSSGPAAPKQADHLGGS